LKPALGDTNFTLAENVQIKDIPDQPYIIEVTETGEIVPLDSPALSIEKTASLSEGALSTEINFTINVTNTGGIPLTSLEVVDTLPEGMSYSSSEPAGIAEGENVTWALGALTSGNSTRINLTAHIDGEKFGTLVNRVNATGTPEVGETVFANDTAYVTAQEANITVEKTADISEGASGAQVNFTIEVENTGDADLVSVIVEDMLPVGLDYVSNDLGVEPARVDDAYTWNLGRLNSTGSKSFNLTAQINGSAHGKLENRVNVTGWPEHGAQVSDSDNETVTALKASIEMEMTAEPRLAALFSNVNFTINVTNTGEIALDPLAVVDKLPEGMSYVSADPEPTGFGSVDWCGRDLCSEPLEPGESVIIELTAQIDGDADANGPLTNLASATGCPPHGCNVSCICSAEVHIPGLEVTKAASKKRTERGEEIEYTITVRNLAEVPVFDVVVEDVFSRDVEFVSASPMPNQDGTWHIETIPENGTVVISLVVKVPKQDLEFEMTSGAEGEGFVNVADDYSTTFQPYVIENKVFVTSPNTYGQFTDTETVTVSKDPGTELSTREHGSGIYNGEEQLALRTENKSIQMEKDVIAAYAPTTLGLYRNRSVAYSSKWTEEDRAKNRVTGASMSESYRYATRIDHESRMILDENGSTMETEAEFEGMGHIGTLKTSKNQDSPSFEAREDYSGSFRIYEKVDEYGSGVESDKSVSGTGFVAAEKRVRESQRTYESGTGTYESEEQIRTGTNYIAKDINVTYQPSSFTLPGGDLEVSQSLKWKEGVQSKTRGVSYISEEFSGADRLDKETVARGLNEMVTDATFSGMGRFRAILDGILNMDEEYQGDYSLQRNVLLHGVPRYDHPHMIVEKEGSVVSTL